jgi:hypothetical protein
MLDVPAIHTILIYFLLPVTCQCSYFSRTLFLPFFANFSILSKSSGHSFTATQTAIFDLVCNSVSADTLLRALLPCPRARAGSVQWVISRR